MDGLALIARLPEDIARVVGENTPDGLTPPDGPYHVTVLVIPDDASTSRLATTRALYAALAGQPAMVAELSGTGHFHESGAIVRLVSMPGVERIRAAAVSATGVTPRWGFVPHVTVGYVDDDQVIDEPAPLSARWNVLGLEVVAGDDVLARIPLV